MFRDHTRTRIYDLFYMITKTRLRFETPVRRRATQRSCSRRTIITRRCIVALASTSPASATAAATGLSLCCLLYYLDGCFSRLTSRLLIYAAMNRRDGAIQLWDLKRSPLRAAASATTTLGLADEKGNLVRTDS